MSRKHFNKSSISFSILLLVFVVMSFSTKAAERLPNSIQWRATAILLDGIDTREKYSIPAKEAVRFISSLSLKIQSAVFRRSCRSPAHLHFLRLRRRSAAICDGKQRGSGPFHMEIGMHT